MDITERYMELACIKRDREIPPVTESIISNLSNFLYAYEIVGYKVSVPTHILEDKRVLSDLRYKKPKLEEVTTINVADSKLLYLELLVIIRPDIVCKTQSELDMCIQATKATEAKYIADYKITNRKAIDDLYDRKKGPDVSTLKADAEAWGKLDFYIPAEENGIMYIKGSRYTRSICYVSDVQALSQDGSVGVMMIATSYNISLKYDKGKNNLRVLYFKSHLNPLCLIMGFENEIKKNLNFNDFKKLFPETNSLERKARNGNKDAIEKLEVLEKMLEDYNHMNNSERIAEFKTNTIINKQLINKALRCFIDIAEARRHYTFKYDAANVSLLAQEIVDSIRNKFYGKNLNMKTMRNKLASLHPDTYLQKLKQSVDTKGVSATNEIAGIFDYVKYSYTDKKTKTKSPSLYPRFLKIEDYGRISPYDTAQSKDNVGFNMGICPYDDNDIDER